MTAPPTESPIYQRFKAVIDRLRPPEARLGAGDKAAAKAAAAQAEELGILGIGAHSDDDALETWTRQLWDEQDPLLREYQKEWAANLIYCSNLHAQSIAYHRGTGRWVRRPIAPGRIRSTYNVCNKAVNIRTQRLVENKPAVTVQAATAEQGDVDKVELKEQLWWSLYTTLKIHKKWTRARRWASKIGSGFLKCGWDPFAGELCHATKKEPRFETITHDPNGLPLPIPKERLVAQVEFYVDNKKRPILGLDGKPVETTRRVPNPDRPGEFLTEKVDPPEGTATYHEGEAFVDVLTSWNVRWDKYTEEISDSWYVQHGHILSASTILGMFPDAVSVLKEAEQASSEHQALQWHGLTPRLVQEEGSSSRRNKSSETGVVDHEYFVLETWIWPKNEHLRKLWGPKGARLVTVGGKLVKRTVLPPWALKVCPFVQVIDIPEEGNHYGRSFLRDLLPIQDDINRSRSTIAEGIALRERLILAAPQNHKIRVSALGDLPGVLLTYQNERKPEVLSLGQVGQHVEAFYHSSLEAAADLGNMNDASTGKLPAAGLAAKAVFALQYAEEKSIAETSTFQDEALQQLARVLDEITKVEYTEARKIRIVGDDRSFLTELEVRPDHLGFAVDYYFVPGSMLSRQKDAIKNEILALKQEGLIGPDEARKLMPTALPEMFRLSYDLQYSRARRELRKLRDGKPPTPPTEWEDPIINLKVLEECMLGASYEALTDPVKDAIQARWAMFKEIVAAQQMPAPGEELPPEELPPEDPEAGYDQAPIGGEPVPEAASGPDQLAESAVSAMEAPEPI